MPKQEHTYVHGRIRRAGISQTEDVLVTGGNSNDKSVILEKIFTSKDDVVKRNFKSKKAQKSVSKKSKNKKWKKATIIVSIAMAVVLSVVSGVYIYADYFLLKTGQSGEIAAENKTPVAVKPTTTNLLIVGVDHSEDGSEEYTNGLGRTDLILYINFNRKDGKINMLQIPRDAYVGKEVPSAGSYKINATYAFGQDQKAPINNLVSVLNSQYKLSVDNYVMMDLDAFRSIVDALGGIRVYIPHELNSYGSRLPQGWNTLDADQSEFFVRVRKGTGFVNGDIDRLDNQRYFYAALFHRFRDMSTSDLTKLLPIFQKYCTTDLNLNDVVPLASDFVSVDSSNILLAKVPTAIEGVTGDTVKTGSPVYVDRQGTADLLNTYYRAYNTQVTVDELGLPKTIMPTNPELMYPANIQVMSDDIISSEEPDAEIKDAGSQPTSSTASSEENSSS